MWSAPEPGVEEALAEDLPRELIGVHSHFLPNKVKLNILVIHISLNTLLI